MKHRATSILVWIVLQNGLALAQDNEFPRYAGVRSCLGCHAQSGWAKECKLEPIPRHAHSFELLSTPRAREIAAMSGISGEPSETRVCLECHSAGADDGPRWWKSAFQPSDGVQCESCHGPGSLHIADAGWQSENAVSTSIKRGDRMDCHLCHTDRPSHREVIERKFSRLPADSHYKTPVSLTLSPDGSRLYVVGEHSDSVLIVDAEKGIVLQEVKVGHRPKAAALDGNGVHLYVTNALSGTLSVVDVVKGQELVQIQVGAEPHGVIVDSSNRRVYVLNTAEDTISIVDVETRQEVHRLVGGTGPWFVSLQPGGTIAAATSVRPNQNRFREPPVSEVTFLDTAEGLVIERMNVAGANMIQGIAWVPGSRTAIATMMRAKNLVPATRLSQGWMITNGLAVLRNGGRVDQVLLDQPNDAFPDLMDIAISPDGRWALVTSGGADMVAVVDVRNLLAYIDHQEPQRRAQVLPDYLGSSQHFVFKRIPVGANPRGVRFSPDGRQAYVCNAFSDSIGVIDVSTWTVSRTIDLGGPSEITPLRNGEQLFHKADITFGRQFSCRSCHPDGHLNGLTFDIEADGPGMKPLDNRTLRGIFDTGPFKWEGTNPSLSRQCGARFAVFFTRQAPFPPPDLDDLVHYIATIERPPNRFRSPQGLTLAQRRGKAIFERTTSSDGAPLKPEDRCTHCHSGAYRTSRQKVVVGTTMWFDATVAVDLRDREMFNADEFGELGGYYFIDTGMPSVEWDVPHLTDIAASPPYLHNGAAQTLEEIWTRYNMINRHGATHGLTKQEINDLIAYLKTQ